MREYLLNVIGAALMVGVIGVLVPADGLKKYVVFIGSLCILGILLSPLTSLANFLVNIGSDGIYGIADSLNDEKKYDEKYCEYMSGLGREAIADEICRLLCENFSIPDGECHVGVTFSGEGEKVALGRVTVILSGRSVFRDPYEIEDYLSRLLGCEVVVTS